MKNRITLFFLLLLVTVSCQKYEEYPNEPHLEFLEFIMLRDAQGIDQRGILRMSYTDGDGNIGLTKDDTVAPYDYNLFIKYFELQNGVFKEITNTGTFNGRIPILTPAGKNKAIRGEIEDTLFVNNFLSTFDTIKFEAYIVDRDLNKSNTVSTPPMLVKKR